MSNRYKGGVISATPPTTTGGEDGTASGAWTLEQQMQLQAAGLWPAQPTGPYIEQVFSTYLYTGNGSTQTITNGIDLASKGGLVWTKGRSTAVYHNLEDTVRGAGNTLWSNAASANYYYSDALTAFGSTGYSLGADGTGGQVNASSVTYASWTFRKQPKFFDVVTYTGNSVAGREIAHNLGSVPGCMIVKSTSDTQDWAVYHRSLGNTKRLVLNGTDAEITSTVWNNTTPTSTVFTVSDNARVNSNGSTYVAYVFAHNAGGFGLTGTDNVISCGSFTTNGSGVYSVNLGYEPQWVLIKRSSTGATGSWYIYDNMRGMPANGAGAQLVPNSSNAEFTGYDRVNINATGFFSNNVDGQIDGNATYIYIAIRRGPMKVPTSGTDVFLPKTRTGNGTAGTVVTGASWPMDALWISRRTGGGAGVGGFTDIDRLRGAYLGGANPLLRQNQTDAESTTYTTSGFVGGQTNYDLPSGGGYGLFNTSGVTYIDYLFRRSPSVFDEVCYTGTGSATTFAHNLGVVPELMIVKRRNASSIWAVYAAPLANASTSYLELSEINAVATGNTVLWNSTSPTSTVFTIGSSSNINTNGSTNVAYLFATCAGVSKVGSYTGTGTTLQVDCGFTGGARFVLIKRTDSTGDWYVWDSARGIVAGNDPYLLLNSTAAEVTNTDYVDTYNAGFEISSTAPAAINANGGTFIFLAIA